MKSSFFRLEVKTKPQTRISARKQTYSRKYTLFITGHPHKDDRLLYIELAISFLIGWKRTVNFGNQRLWHHTYRLYNNHVKVRGIIMSCDRGAWFPRVIMSSSHASCGEEAKQRPGLQVNVYCRDLFFFVQCIIKQLLDSVLWYPE